MFSVSRSSSCCCHAFVETLNAIVPFSHDLMPIVCIAGQSDHTRPPKSSIFHSTGVFRFFFNEYWAKNFNGMFSSMNVLFLFNLLVVNNWTACEISFKYVTGESWCESFF
jgi:hypothetical protein